MEAKQRLEQERYELSKLFKRGPHTKASKIRHDFQTSKLLNASLDAPNMKSEEPRLPVLKPARRPPEDELLSLIRRNQAQVQRAAQKAQSLKPEPKPKNLLQSQNVNLLTGEGGQMSKLKEDKSELLSQYFSAKRSMKNKL